MFDNIQTVDNTIKASEDAHGNMLEDSYRYNDKVSSSSLTGSQSSNDRTLLNRDDSKSQFSVPPLELFDPTQLAPQERQFSSEYELAQTPTEKEVRSAKMLEDLGKFAADNKLTISNLDAVGIKNISEVWQRVFDNCPKKVGETKVTETGGQLTGQTSFGPSGERVSSKTGQISDRYFKNEDGFSCHARTVNTIGAGGEFERVMETENHTKIYLNNQIPADGRVRIDVLMPDGKSGCQLDVQSSQLKEVLKLIRQSEKMPITSAPAS
jgi:hypothetical protein